MRDMSLKIKIVDICLENSFVLRNLNRMYIQQLHYFYLRCLQTKWKNKVKNIEILSYFLIKILLG